MGGDGVSRGTTVDLATRALGPGARTPYRTRYNANHSCLRYDPVRLSDLKKGDAAIVLGVEEARAADPVARRLGELGFVVGEPVRVVATGPFGGDPLLVQVGFTRFALRRSEAERVRLVMEDLA